MSNAPLAVTPARVVVATNRRRLRKDNWFAFWLILPTILMVIGVSIYPVYYAVRTSLLNYNPSFGFKTFVGLDNYEYILRDAAFRDALLVTARFAISSTVLSW